MIEVVQRQAAQNQMFAFEAFPYGLNTVVPPTMLSTKEMPGCVDFRLGPKGQLITRKAVTKLTTAAMVGNPVSVATAIIDGTQRDIIGCDNGLLYYLDGTVPTLIDTAEGSPYLIPFNDVCMVCDGSYLKFLDGVSALKIAYDSGNGTQFDNYAGSNDSGIAIGNGTNTRAAVKFTSDTWDSGYTIPITQIEAFLQKVGSPTGTITAKLRKVSDDSVLASKDFGETANQISTSGEYVSVTFTEDDITTEMSPNTDYYATIEHSGNSSNYIQLRCTSTTGAAYYYDGVWHADTTKNPRMKVYPGTAPKCSFGTISNRRPWLAGDPDNPGYAWYGMYSHLDFSTPGGGGYVPVIDDNSNTFEVGALQDLYGQLFVYGTEDQPYLSRLTGTSPANYTLPLTFQRAWSTQRTLINTKNDLWSGARDGVDSLAGVEKYGDFRSYSLTDSVADRFDSWQTSTAFAGYYPDHALYLLHLPLHGKTLVGHTRSLLPDDLDRIKYPWTEFDFPVTPTCFGQLSTGFVIGADDGYLYQFSDTEHRDLGITQVPSYFYTPKIQFPANKVSINQIQYIVDCVSGLSFQIAVLVDGDDDNPILQLSSGIGDLKVEDATMLLSEATGLISTEAYPPRHTLNFTCHTVQLKFHSVVRVRADEAYFNGCFIRFKRTSL